MKTVLSITVSLSIEVVLVWSRDRNPPPVVTIYIQILRAEVRRVLLEPPEYATHVRRSTVAGTNACLTPNELREVLLQHRCLLFLHLGMREQRRQLHKQPKQVLGTVDIRRLLVGSTLDFQDILVLIQCCEERNIGSRKNAT